LALVFYKLVRVILVHYLNAFEEKAKSSLPKVGEAEPTGIIVEARRRTEARDRLIHYRV
jgi:hypothetical protein